MKRKIVKLFRETLSIQKKNNYFFFQVETEFVYVVEKKGF